MQKLKVSDMSIHKASELSPLMTPEQFRALVISIEENGQIEPVKLYRGKIVDGRHRLKALKQLGVETIDTTSLPNNMTLDEINDLVLTYETRRHQTPTQLAIFAWKQMKELGISSGKASKMFGPSKANISRVNKIVELGGTALIDDLQDGKKLEIYIGQKKRTTDSLAQIRDYLDAKRITRTDEEIIIEDSDPSDKEMEIINKVFNLLAKQSQYARTRLADRLYAYDNPRAE